MCAECQSLQQVIEDLKDQLQAERGTISQQARTVLALERKLKAKDEDENVDPLVKQLLTYAAMVFKKNRNWETGAKTDRYQLTDKTLREKTKLARKQGHPKDKAVGVAFDWCKTVIFGLSLIPYVGARGRAGLPYAGSKRLVDIQYAFGEQQWERCWLEATGQPWADDPEVIERDKAWAADSTVPPADSPQWARAMRSAKQTGDALAAIQPLLFNPKDDPADAVIHALEQRGLSWRCTGGSNWVAQCPAHDDRSPSMTFTDDGEKVLVHCFAGCTGEEIREGLGLEWSAFFRSERAA